MVDVSVAMVKGSVMNILMNLAKNIWLVWGQMAPYLLLGFAIAGMLYAWIKPSFVQRHFGKGSFLPVLKTTLLGIPLPLCSCSVIPVAASLRQQGANKGAASAFLLATPQTGVDSIAVTYSLLGGFFALLRPLVALVSGLAGGLIINILDKDSPQSDDHTTAHLDHASHCCDADSHCATDHTDILQPKSRITFMQGMKYGFFALPQDIGRALVVGVVIAGAIGALAPPDIFERIPGGFITQMLFMLVIGIPLYICATSSVPVAAALIMKGLSPGAALVLLIAGPAANAASISAIWKIMGRRTALIYLIIVAVTALAAGFIAQYLLGWGFTVTSPIGHEHGLHVWEIVTGIALIIILLIAFFPQFRPSYPIFNTFLK